MKGNGDLEDLVDKVYKSVSTYKSKQALYIIQNAAIDLKENSKVLVLGAGRGAETIVIKTACPSCAITSIDLWDGELDFYDDGKTNFPGTNFEKDFDFNCASFNVKVDKKIKTNIYTTNIIEEIKKDWDFIYYDCIDNGDGKSTYLIIPMLKRLWSQLNSPGILMGDDYIFDRPDFKMSPVVDIFVNELKDSYTFDFDRTNKSFHWMVKKT